MRKPSGKLNFVGILLVVFIFYGGFVAFKFISSNIAKGQLKTDIENMLGQYRGPDFTEEEGRELIAKLMYEKGVISEAQRVMFVEDAGYDNGEEASSGDENADSSDNGKAKKVSINVKLKDRKSKIRFVVQYETDLDLLIFKTRRLHTIEEEVFNYN